MTQPADELERLAAGIADDERVDWRLLARLSGRDARTGGGLLELSHLARAFRQAELEPAPPRERTARFGNLDILEPLGQGAQGEVFRAYDPMLDSHVALKLKRADSDALNHRFLEEARRLAKIRHGNVLSVFGAAVEDGRAGIWTELVRGQSLAERLELAGRLDADEAVEIALQLASALGAVHRHGVVHGDVKASNVMIEHGGRVVLMDFGTARQLGAANDSGVISGTPHYLAPELLDGVAPSPSSDVYALGVLLFHMLSGDYPYPPDEARSADRAARARARQPLARLAPELPKRLVARVEASIDPDPSMRPASAAELARGLRGALAPPSPRRWAWLAAGAIAALALIVLARGVLTPSFAPGMALYRVGAGGEAQLSDGANVALGDRLALKLALDRDAWVYVLADDGRGHAVLLHPLAARDNPQHAAPALRLPRARDGAPLAWQVDSEAEAEEFLVAVGDRPLATLDALSAEWRAPYASDIVTRGTASVVAAPESASTSIALRDLQRQLEPDLKAGHARIAHYRLPHRR